MSDGEKRVVIVGGGFAGLNAAKALAREKRVGITLIDRRNHHLFQPLLYQVSLPGIAPVAMQQGRHMAKVVICDLDQRPRPEFRYTDKGQMATIGRSCAIAQVGKYQMTGFFAWLAWLVVHIYFLTGFRNRLFVILSWTWSFLSFRRGARLILAKNWRFYDRPSIEPKE